MTYRWGRLGSLWNGGPLEYGFVWWWPGNYVAVTILVFLELLAAIRDGITWVLKRAGWPE